MGKSEKELKQVLTFRGDAQDKETIEQISQAWGCSKGEAIRQALKLVVEFADELSEEDIKVKKKKTFKAN